MFLLKDFADKCIGVSEFNRLNLDPNFDGHRADLCVSYSQPRPP